MNTSMEKEDSLVVTWLIWMSCTVDGENIALWRGRWGPQNLSFL